MPTRPKPVWMLALWVLAALVALVNGFAMLRRHPLLQKEAQTQRWHDAKSMAQTLNSLPANTKSLLVFDSGDETANWARYRINYDTYPRIYDYVWDTAPAEIRGRYDFVSHFPPTSAKSTTLARVIAPKLNITPFQIIKLFGIILFSLLFGVALLACLVSQKPFSNPLGNLAIAHLLGVVAITILLQLSCFLTGQFSLLFVYIIAIPLGIYGFIRLRNLKPSLPNSLDHPLPSSLLTKIALALTAMLLTFSLLAAVQRGWLLGLDWDGYAIWQLKAKAFFYDGDMRLLRDAAHFEYAHRDYPLLIPLASFWLYANAGAVWDGAAQCLNLLFYLDLLAIFYAVARRTTAPQVALLGTALVASLPLAVHHAVSGFADVPFAAYFLAVGVCLLIRAPAPLAAALSVGLLFTKNEGALACLLFLPLLFAASPSPKRNRLAGHIAVLGIAFAPWLLCKRAAGIHGDMEANQLSRHAYGTILERIAPTCKAWLMHLAQVGPWYPCWGLLGLLIFAGFLNAKKAQDRLLRLFLLFPLLQALGYSAIYLITPHDLLWHLTTSMDRLLLHLAPTLLLGALLTCFPASASSH